MWKCSKLLDVPVDSDQRVVQGAAQTAFVGQESLIAVGGIVDCIVIAGEDCVVSVLVDLQICRTLLQAASGCADSVVQEAEAL